ncbi:Respiratory growth induced protein 1 [Pichia californica]|nr:Respiratory growth induced protein 1 [[Candida] californica]
MKPAHMEPVHIEHLDKAPIVRNSREMYFESLDDFERYIMDESWDNEFDNLNIHVKYLPPFIVNQTKGNEEKIKPQMNSLNKKFRRHLQHHVKRHLLPDINRMAGIDYEFHKEGEEKVSNEYGSASVYKWHFKDDTNHGFDESEFGIRGHWKVEVDIESNSTNPWIDVTYKSISDSGEQVSPAAVA